MDSKIFELFSLEEVLARLGQSSQTGCLHIFTQRESANIFIKDGTIVAAASGLSEGEKVVTQVLKWKEARLLWQPNETAPASFRFFSGKIADFLQAPSGSSLPIAPAPAALVAKPVVTIPGTTPVVPTTAKAITKVLSPASDAAQPTPGAPPLTGAPIQLMATKAMPSTAQTRSAQEELLLQKHRLALVSAQDPKQRIKIARASILIGRNPACDIALDHASISRQHCLLQLTDRGLHMKDLNTTNGTKVNGIALTEGYVTPGDKLMIGHEVYLLVKE